MSQPRFHVSANHPTDELDRLKAAGWKFAESVDGEMYASPPATAPDSLDAAWAEAEAALPEGVAFTLTRAATPSDGRPTAYYATADPIYSSAIRSKMQISGPTPAAALRALAARLRGEG